MRLNNMILESKADQEKFKQWIGLDKINNKTIGEIYLDKFNNIKNSIKSPQNDMYYWIKNSTPNTFKDFVDDIIYKRNQKQDVEKKAQQGAELLYSDKDWKVYHITNYEASAKYGKGSKWCISGSKEWSNGEKGEEYFNNYTKEGIDFYFFINKTTKYALAVDKRNQIGEIFSAEDVQIPYIPNAPKIENIGVEYWLNDDINHIILENAFANQKFPFEVARRLMNEAAYEWNDIIYDLIILDNVNQFLDQIDNMIPDGYIEYNALKEGSLTEEEYKKLTGETNIPTAWDGDLPLVNIDEYNFPIKGITLKTKKDLLNPSLYKNIKYFCLSMYSDYGYDSGEYEIDYNKDWLGLIRWYESVSDANNQDPDEFWNEIDRSNRGNIFIYSCINIFIDRYKEEYANDITPSMMKSWGVEDSFIQSLDAKDNVEESLKEDKEMKKEPVGIDKDRLEEDLPKIKEYIEQHFKDLETTLELSKEPLFILPDGRLINVFENSPSLSTEGETIHSNLIEEFISDYYDSLYTYGGWDCLYEPYDVSNLDLLDWFTYNFKLIRFNAGSNWVEDRAYCVIPKDNKITSEQSYTLRDCIDYSFELGKQYFIVFLVNENGSSVTDNRYSNIYSANKIVNAINNFYYTNELRDLTESNSNTDKEAENVYVDYPSMMDDYYDILDDIKFDANKLKTTSTFIHGPMFIDPKGNLINILDNLNPDDLERSINDLTHSDLMYQFVINYYNIVYGKDEWEDGLYNSDVAEFLDPFSLRYGYARINFGVTQSESRWYCVLPDRLTSAQYDTLERFIHEGNEKLGLTWLQVAILSSDNITKWGDYDLDLFEPYDVIKCIKNYYTSGRLRSLTDLDESLKENKEQDVVYHGSSALFDKFSSPINWFSKNIEYAKEFALWLGDKHYLYTCKINPKKLFDAGNTSERVFSLLPIKPFRFSDAFNKLIYKLGLKEDEVRPLLDQVIDEYDVKNDGYQMRIDVFVRSTIFKNILIKKGYDGIKAIEQGNECYGIFNPDDIEIINRKNIEEKGE